MDEALMQPVLFLQNGPEDGPGLFARTLSDIGIPCDIVHAWRGDPIPATLEAHSGLALGGGHISAYHTDAHPFLLTERALVLQAHQRGIPVLGMCLGAQLMAAALGASVHRNHTQEIGFFEVRFHPAAADDPLWHGLTQPLFPVHWHRDTFALPPDATLLASSDITPHQAFRWGRLSYGFQFHLEFDLPVINDMIREDHESLLNCGVDPHQFIAQAHAHLPNVEPIGRTVFTRWAALLPSANDQHIDR